MVDLHQTEPGLPDGHPWGTYSRWHMAWRVGLGVSAAGMLGTLLVSLVTLGSGSMNIIESLMPHVFALVVPVLCAGVAAAFGPWLTRFYPFSQSLLFGAMGVVAATLLASVLAVWERLDRGPCPPDTLCASPFEVVMLVVNFGGLPVFLGASIGFGLAVWASTRRGNRVFWPGFGGVLAVFVTAILIANW